MKNRLKKRVLLSLFSLCLFSCYSDEGNYDYKQINEISISQIEKTYTVMQGVDTLRIKPEINETIDKNGSGDYSYKWEVNKMVLGTEKNLNYVVELPKGKYSLYYKVMDNKTGVEWKTYTSLNVVYPFIRGFVLTGDDKDGFLRMDMVAMVQDGDTIILKDMFENSDMPKIKGGRKTIHVGMYSQPEWVEMWAIGDDGSYFVDPITFKSSLGNVFTNFLYTTAPIPLDLAVTDVEPIANNGGGNSNRVIRCNNGWIFRSSIFDGRAYGNPLNYVKAESPDYFNTAPYVIYAPGYFSGGVMLYDNDNDRFVRIGGFDTFSSVFKDEADPIFPWNNADLGRKLKYVENTRNSDGGSTYGNSFALMKNNANDAFWIYKFYAHGGSGKKRDMYEVKTSIAKDLDKASMFAFSSKRTVLFYVVGSKLYAYDYNKNNEKLVEMNIGNNGDEITMIKFDIQSDDMFNNLYVATYNATTGGTFMKFTLDELDKNNVKLEKDTKATWSGLCKIRHMDWRNS